MDVPSSLTTPPPTHRCFASQVPWLLPSHLLRSSVAHSSSFLPLPLGSPCSLDISPKYSKTPSYSPSPTNGQHFLGPHISLYRPPSSLLSEKIFKCTRGDSSLSTCLLQGHPRPSWSCHPFLELPARLRAFGVVARATPWVLI